MNMFVEHKVPGTSSKIIARKTTANLDGLGDFLIVRNTCTADRDRNSVKLSWDKLRNKDLKPLSSPPMILNRFKELEADGWEVDQESLVKFKNEHFPQKSLI